MSNLNTIGVLIFSLLMITSPIVTATALPTISEDAFIAQPENKRCLTDNDCVLVDDPCAKWGWYLINQAAKRQLDEQYPSIVEACSNAPILRPHYTCSHKLCVFVENATGCIFAAGISDSMGREQQEQCFLRCEPSDITGICKQP
jgi:hypothetical protein